MSARALGERAGWLLAATVLVVGGTIGFDRRPPVAAPADPVSVVDAAREDGAPDPTAPDLLGDPLGARRASDGRAIALGDHTVDWPGAELIAPQVPAPAQLKAPPVWWTRYTGTNHVWMPTLGINRRVYSFPCSRGTSPDNLVYRWGCSGRNNVYLLGHAYGVFKALHDAYSHGKLRVGMPVIYADGHGRVRLYRVVTWRVVNPRNATWAIASQPVPSMTLQTCVGPKGSLRLNVRLVLADS
jgi:hypothetical protein